MDWKQVVVRGETPNVDFKAATSWSGEDRVRLTKALVAMANTRDGGVLIVGVDDDRSGGQPRLAGLTPAQLVSFDPTKVAEFVNSRFEPPIQLRVEKPTIDGQNLVVIVVQEFSEEPLVCVAQGVCTEKVLFKPGDLLVRTSAAQSQVAGPQELRELLGRAVAKKGEHLLEQMRRIVKGTPVVEVRDWRELLAQDLAVQSQSVQEVMGRSRYGVWVFTAAPVEPPEKPLAHSALAQVVRQSAVSLRGADFPGGRIENVTNRTGRVSCEISFGQFVERWELFQKLLFSDIRSLWEDTVWIKQGDVPGTQLSFVNAIYTVAEFVLFVKRLYASLGYDGDVVLQIRLVGSKSRRLVSRESLRFLHGEYVCAEPEISLARAVHVTELASGWEELAADFVQELFALFNWSNVSRDMIRQDIANLRDKRI